MRELVPGFERHYRQHVGLKEASLVSYTQKVREFCAWLEGNAYTVEAQTVTRRQIEEYLDWCFRQGNINATRRTKIIALRRFFDFLVYEELLPSSPADRIPLPRVGRRAVKTFTQEEVLRLFLTCEILTEKGLRDVVIFILAAFGGLRGMEICNLRVEDCIWDGDRFWLQVVESKHGENRIITNIWKLPQQFLQSYMQLRISSHGAGPGDPLCVSMSRKRLTPGALDNLLKEKARKAKIRKSVVKMHMFRATHATDLMKVEGWDIHSVSKRLGHRDIRTTADNYVASWDPVRKRFPSLASYWKVFNHKLWQEGGGEKG